MANVYRFNEMAGVNPPEGPTFYLTPVEARRMAIGLLSVAESIETESFGESPDGVGAQFAHYDDEARQADIYDEAEEWEAIERRANEEGNERLAARASRIVKGLEYFAESLK